MEMLLDKRVKSRSNIQANISEVLTINDDAFTQAG